VADNFFALGGDSIVSLQVVARMRAAGWVVTPRQVFERQTVRKLAAVAEPSDQGRPAIAEQGVVTGPLPLIPVQAAFLAEPNPAPHHYNQAVLLRPREPVRLCALERALRHVAGHHDALRLRFSRAGDGWHQEQAGLDGLPERLLRVVDLTEVPPHDQPAAVTAVAAGTQASLDLAAGCLLRAVYADLGAGRPGRLLLVIHHLAVDGVSWRVLLEDLARAYTRIVAGEPVALPPKTTAFRDWARHLARHANSDEIGGQAEHWHTTLSAGAETGLAVDLLPEDELGSANTRACLAAVTATLDAEHTRLLLGEVPAAYRARVDEVLLTAAGTALAEWTDDPRLLIDLEEHGRADLGPRLDVSRTVGWFTSVYPVLLELADGDPVAALRQVKERLRRVPADGLGYGLLRYLRAGDPLAARLAELPPAAISFNYLGQLDQSFRADGLWEPAEEFEGPAQDMEAPRPYLLEIDAMVLAGELRIIWSYSNRLHLERTITGLAERCVEVLRTLIERRHDPEAGGYSPSDLTGVELTQAQLDGLLARFGSS
jgi:non-ribosomal peptide synthase protein (TIGR01720 family)